jgi:hypothetical protein
MTLQEIVEKHGINIHEENVTIVGEDGTLELVLEDGTLEMKISITDRVVIEPGLNIMDLL